MAYRPFMSESLRHPLLGKSFIVEADCTTVAYRITEVVGDVAHFTHLGGWHYINMHALPRTDVRNGILGSCGVVDVEMVERLVADSKMSIEHFTTQLVRMDSVRKAMLRLADEHIANHQHGPNCACGIGRLGKTPNDPEYLPVGAFTADLFYKAEDSIRNSHAAEAAAALVVGADEPAAAPLSPVQKIAKPSRSVEAHSNVSRRRAGS